MEEKELHKARLEFLEDTVKYYSEDTKKRGYDFNVGVCKYKTDDGKKCAIGRHIEDSKYESGIEGWPLQIEYLDYLPLSVSNLGFEFLVSIQKLHDVNLNWNKEIGLTEKGLSFIQKIKKKFCGQA